MAMLSIFLCAIFIILTAARLRMARHFIRPVIILGQGITVLAAILAYFPRIPQAMHWLLYPCLALMCFFFFDALHSSRHRSS